MSNSFVSLKHSGFESVVKVTVTHISQLGSFHTFSCGARLLPSTLRPYVLNAP